MKVKALMRLKPKTVFPNTPLSSVWKAIAKRKLSILPVIDDKKIIKGIISAEDLLIRLIPDYREFFSAFYPYSPEIEDIEEKIQKQMVLFAKDVMNRKVYTVTQNQDIFKALSRMIAYHVMMLPVVDKQSKLKGIISEEDIFGFLFMKKKRIFVNLEDKFVKEKKEEIVKKKVRSKLTKLAQSLKQKPSNYFKIFKKDTK